MIRELGRMKTCIDPFCREQFFVTSRFDQTTLVDDEDLIRALYCRQSMGDY
jgi:hypothetical protein